MAASLTFEEFYAKAFRRGMRHLSCAFGTRPVVAEDIVQSALVEFWQHYPDPSVVDQPFALFWGYLDNFARRTFVQAPVSLDRPVDPQRPHVTYADLLPSSAASVETQVLARLRWQEVVQRITQLDADDQAMVRLLLVGHDLRHIQGYLSTHFGFTGSYHTVGTRLYRVRQALRQQTQTAKLRRHLKRARLHQPWSSSFAACRRCGTTTIAHKAKGYCEACCGRMYHQEMKQGQRQKQRKWVWSFQHPACVACGTTAIVHEGRGYCRACYWQIVGKPKAGVLKKTRAAG